MSRDAALRAAFALALVLAPSPTAAAWAQDRSADPAVVAQGGQLVGRNCGMCHAIGRSDQSLAAGAPAFRDLHERYEIGALAEALAEGILIGHPAMPEFRFEPKEVAAIIAYLQSIQSRQKTLLRTGPNRLTSAKSR